MNKKQTLEDLIALANILMDNCKPENLNKHDLQKYYEIEERIMTLFEKEYKSYKEPYADEQAEAQLKAYLKEMKA